MNNNNEHILVIKLSALGDFIQALGPMAAIRKHHPDAHITLLTTNGFTSFAKQCGYFDDVLIDTRPKWYQFTKISALKKTLNGGQFDRVYDLQNNDRTNGYFKLFTAPKPEWVGTAKGASHRNTSSDRTAGHAYDGHVQTLALAGINNISIDRLEWMDGDISGITLPKDYVVLVAGCAAAHPHKRWPAAYYAELGAKQLERGLTPVLIGTDEDKDATDAIKAACPTAIDLNGQTSLPQIVAIARNAKATIGNDTGPMHLIGATGSPCLSLFSGQTDPIRHAPKGDAVTTLQEHNLHDLSVDRVLSALDTL